MRLVVVVLALIGCKYAPTALGDDAGTDGSVTADSPVDVPPGTWLEPFSHRRPITISASQVTVPSGGLIDFPVLVDTNVAIASMAGGADLVFTDATGVQLLDSELELLDVGRVVAWVKIPSLSNAADTELFLYYGNPTPPPTNPGQVWSAFKGVWHLNQDPEPAGVGDIADSTANNKDGTAATSMDVDDLIDGHIGRALRFDDPDDSFVRVPSMIDVGSGFTISAWINVSAGANTIVTVFSNSNSGLDIDGFRMFVNSQNTADRRLFLETSIGGVGGSDTAVTDVGAVPTGAWAHVAAVVDRTAGSARLFVNAVDLTIDQTIRTGFKTDSTHTIARMGDAFSFEGMIDEVEVSAAKLAPEWIQTTFDSQKAGNTFLTVGNEEAAP